MQDLIGMAKEIADASGIPGELVCAIVEQESNWNTWAIRMEPGFYSTYVAPLVAAGKIANQTEAYARAFSWGLMQVMGQTAREHDFVGDFPHLCDPHSGLAVGCKVFMHKLTQTKGDTQKALLLWSGGTNPAYPAQVLGRVGKYK